MLTRMKYETVLQKQQKKKKEKKEIRDNYKIVL